MKRIIFILFLFISAIHCQKACFEEKRFIYINENKPTTWMSQEETFELFKQGIKYVDVTNDPDFSFRNGLLANAAAIPRVPRFQEIVNKISANISQERLSRIVENLSSLHTRFIHSDGGEEGEKWILYEVLSKLVFYGGDSTVTEVNHTWRQNSIIARLEGKDPVLRAERVILGAHLDSRSFEDMENGEYPRAPGADDDAAGVAVLLETMELLVQNNLLPKRTIEFHFYAAEECGLLGSHDIARSYRDANVSVASMMEFDVVGFQGEGITDIGIYTDGFESPELVEFAKALTNEYLEFGWRNKSCPGDPRGCSDHAAWTGKGYPALMIGEYENNDEGWHYHRTVNDTLEFVSFTQVKEMVKLAVGFVIEVAEPIETVKAF